MEFGGMKSFTPQVPPLNLSVRPPSLSGGAIRGADGNVPVMRGWDPVAPNQQNAPAQLGDNGRGAQSVPFQQQPQYQQPQYQQPRAQAQPQAPAPYMAGPEELHNFAVQAHGRDGRPYTANLQVGFPQGTRVVGYLPPRPPTWGMNGQEELHVFTIRGIDRNNREQLRDIEVAFPSGVSQPTVSETF